MYAPGGAHNLALVDASAVILAGGKSSRLGRPKPVLPFGEHTMLERIVLELAGGFSETVVVARPRNMIVGAVMEGLRIEPSSGPARLRVVHDSAPYEGPLKALASALEVITCERAFVCSCDLPLLRADVALALCEMLDEGEAAIPEVGGRLQPLCAAYRRGAAGKMRAAVARGESRMAAVYDALDMRIIPEARLRAIDPELRSFFNVNTEADYRIALGLAGIQA